MSASTGSSLEGTLEEIMIIDDIIDIHDSDNYCTLAESTMQRRHWSILTARISALESGSPFNTWIFGRFCRSFHSPGKQSINKNQWIED